MPDYDRLPALLADCQRRLALVERALALELSKPLFERRITYLTLLDRERAVYSFGAALLEELRTAPALDECPQTALSVEAHREAV